jgi:hypothetical protein
VLFLLLLLLPCVMWGASAGECGTRAPVLLADVCRVTSPASRFVQMSSTRTVEKASQDCPPARDRRTEAHSAPCNRPNRNARERLFVFVSWEVCPLSSSSQVSLGVALLS